MIVAKLTAEVTRLKREDHNVDSQFCKWKVLIGTDDWEDYSVGKEGVARYRVENLPRSSSSGIYELAIYRTGSSSRDNPSKLDPDKILVVYLGEADNVRTRLQQHGRTGTHLGRNFEDMFSRGYSIVYRWVPMENKADAQRTEAQLLKYFDYAWNKGSNGARRHDDILEILDKRASNRTTPAIFSRKHLPFLQKQIGIKIKASKLLSQDNEFSKYADGESYNFLRQVSKFSRSQPRLVLDHGGSNENDTITCGVVLGDASICRRPPVEGRKRCAEHKGKKTKGSSMTLSTSEKQRDPPYVVFDSYANEASGFDKKSSKIFLPGKVETGVALRRPVFSEGYDTICGVELGDGYFCTKQPVGGRIRCEDHKGMRVTSPLSGLDVKSTSDVFDTDSRFNSHNRNYGNSSSSTSICGATKCNGSSSQRTVKVDGRCWQHLNYSSSSSGGGNSSAKYLNYGGSISSICGAPTLSGSSCQRTVMGNERCWQHSNYDGSSSGGGNSRAQYLNYGGSTSSICGAPTRSGSSCQRTVMGNERCWQHSNYGSSSSNFYPQYSNSGGCSTSICGAPTRNGSFCQRTVRGNGRCWQH
ncbi:hypothetical protein CRYUN_Cryun02cG0016200 [Craigia yunnanensis]